MAGRAPVAVLDKKTCAVLNDILVGTTGPDRSHPAAVTPWELALAGYAASMQLDHDRAAALAGRALLELADGTGGPADVVLACAVAALASAGRSVADWSSMTPGLTPSGDAIADALVLVPALTDDAHARLAGAILADAALTCGRVAAAVDVLALAPVGWIGHGAGGRHPFSALMGVTRVRVAAFNGRIAEAAEVLDSIDPSGLDRIDLLVDATRCLVSGNTANPSTVSRIADRVEASEVGDDRIARGIVTLAAFGLAAIGDVHRSARLALVALQGREVMVIDRVLTIEMVLAAAILDGDQDAAEAWVELASPLADDRIADSTVARMRARVALMRGDPAASMLVADAGILRAQREGRRIEEATGELVAARARIAGGRRGEAIRHLSAVVAAHEREGNLAIRRSANSELRGTGRRLSPIVGSGREGLSARERDVLDLLLAGRDNTAIAADLHLSIHTVREHVSRVLAAHGVPTRMALLVDAVAERARAGLPGGKSSMGRLTSRQREVVAELLSGAGNAEIAARTGVTVRTVEMHLHTVMAVWGVRSRAEVVAIAGGLVTPSAELAR